MIVKRNNNIVDYKCKVYSFFFQNATNPSLFFFFMLVYVIKKDISSWSRTRVSGVGDSRSKGTPKATGTRAPLFEVRRVRFTHRLYWYTHLLHRHPTVGINAPPENLLFCCFLWFSLSSLRFLPPGVGLTGSSRPSNVLLEFKTLILKTAQAYASKRRRILIGREDISHLG